MEGAACAEKTMSDESLSVYMPRAGDNAAEVMAEFIMGNTNRLRLAAYGLNHPVIVAAIFKQYEKGVPLQLITDHVQSAGREQLEVLEQLHAAGVQIKVNHHAGLMHLKLAIRGDPPVDLADGSFNWTNNAQEHNDEILTIYSDTAEKAQRAAVVFDCMWADETRFAPWQPPTPQERAGMMAMPPSPF